MNYIAHATSTEKSLGRYIVGRNDSFEMNLVIYKQNKKGRKNLTATGERSRASSNSRSNASREQEPWLLATSLPTKIAEARQKSCKNISDTDANRRKL
ncbi:MAG: hypothetical protein Q9N32_04835 [Gammaproteobacteria bacterium]|nr:hypothetical protein [Gammaproteobacteria bacterium]